MPAVFRPIASRPMADFRLICIPFAGSGAGAFRGWGPLLPPSIDAIALQLPGREDLCREPPFAEWPQMMEDVRRAVGALPALPLAIFGHSLGALIAFELARSLAGTSATRVVHLWCAARPWPGVPPADSSVLPFEPEIDDAELVSRLASAYGDLPASFSNAAISDYFLPILRADMKLLRSYRYEGSARLSCPLTIFSGSRDPVTMGGDLALWNRETSGAFDMVELPSGHFFLESERARITSQIAARLSRLAR